MTVYSKRIEFHSDIMGFFIHLRHDLQLNFHPDDRFADYYYYQGDKPSFDRETCAAYEKIMDDCYAWCAANKEDIYQIAVESSAFSEFLESYEKITEKQAMETFAKEFINENYGIDAIIALHTYGGCYWIEEYQEDGKTMFRCIIENTNPFADNLRDMEVSLFDWTTKEVSPLQGGQKPCPSCIRNRADIIRFFAYLYNDRDLDFHPDSNFRGYMNGQTSQPTFTEDECKQFDRLMNGAHRWCRVHQEDVYELGLDLISFFDTHIRLVHPKPVEEHFREHIDPAYEKSEDFVALHVYQSTCWIEERMLNGKPFYQMALGNVNQASTNLCELELDLFDNREHQIIAKRSSRKR